MDTGSAHLPRRTSRRAILGGLLPERMHKHAECAAGGSLPATSRHRDGGMESDPLLLGCRHHRRGPVHDRRHGPRVVLHLLWPTHHWLFPLPVDRDEVGPTMEGGEVRASGEQGGTAGIKETCV